MTDNIFILIENHLAKPSQESLEKIKTCSHELANNAFLQAIEGKLSELTIKIGQVPLEPPEEYREKVEGILNQELVAYFKADPALPNEEFKHFIMQAIPRLMENIRTTPNFSKDIEFIQFINHLIDANAWMPILKDTIEDQAQKALSLGSGRLIKNESFQQRNKDNEDAPYIFRVSESEAQKVKTIISEMTGEAKITNQRPDGLIFSYSGYVERRKNSQFQYADDMEIKIRKHVALLELKVQNLEKRKHKDPADILRNTQQKIAAICQETNAEAKSGFTADQLSRISTALTEARKSPVIQAHRGDAKQILANFLYAISIVGLVYLKATSSQRGSFWYRTNTDTEDKLDAFKKDLPSPQ
ncbi:hypothetical protein [Legionella cardiaca]|uniref:VipE n=1 Tax=Legionella cardiaca TaxID=1071983 RepID=A0ABY8AU43_9GAMM|nr:hypothetical protein [Legionella cardiaca]WED43706.1 hypothetical protein PXX05_02710 [Legionella cardiaca]